VAAWRVIAALVAVALVVAYAWLSGLWVTTEGSWYVALTEPPWQPPGWVFGVAWTYNYVMLVVVGVAMALRSPARLTWHWLGFVAASSALGVLWAYVFYEAQSLVWAAVLLTLAALVNVGAVVVAAAAARWRGWAMVPYQVWLLLAASLSWGYVVYN
jgi:translocator protein